MILDTTSKSLQVVLGAAPATTQAALSASYADLTATTFVGANANGVSAGTSPVTLVAAPGASTQRQLKHINIYNADTAPMQVTVQLVDGATTRILYSTTMLPGQTLEWTPDSGWTTALLLTSTTPDFISGLKLAWLSSSSISISSGEAWIPGSNKLAYVAAPVTLTGIALGASTWGHVYVNAAGAFQCVTTAPASPYVGTARTKTGDTTWRYVGSVLTDGSGNLFGFNHAAEAGHVFWQAAVGSAPFAVLNNGAATTTTNVSLTGCIPVTAVAADIQFYNNDTGGATLRLGNSLMGTLSSSLWMARAVANASVQSDQSICLPTDTSQAISYLMTGTPAGGSVGASIRVNGYIFER